ncbi:MAG: hypothetical protein EPN89_01725 [Methylovulum sp.]|nr:MAG: hypothetical protein EPN89_01725 [Methylovulum sp.]
MLEPIDYWRLHDELTVIQATLLVLGEDPSDYEDSGYSKYNDNGYNKPTGFDSIFSAITKAINSKKLDAILRYKARGKFNENGWVEPASNDQIEGEFSRWTEGYIASETKSHYLQ